MYGNNGISFSYKMNFKKLDKKKFEEEPGLEKIRSAVMPVDDNFVEGKN